MKLTSLFLENFFSQFSLSSFISESTTISTSTTSTEITALAVGSTGCNIMDDEPIFGTTMVTSATTTGSNALTAFSDVQIKQLYVTQAYIESLNEEELEEFIVKLESKEIKVELEQEETKEKTI